MVQFGSNAAIENVDYFEFRRTPVFRQTICAAATAVISASAFAADLPSRQVPPVFDAAPPMFSWSGAYIGLNAGGSMGKFGTTDLGGTFGTGDATAASSSGFSGGGQIGYNHQFARSNVVVGIEADFQGSTLQGDYDRFTSNGQAGWQDGSKVNWWGTVRGRVGYAVGRLLPYATGGFAYGHTGTSGSCYAVAGPFGCDQAAGSVGHTSTGWTAGAGLEYAVTDNLIFRTEYLYTDLGSQNSPDTFLDATFGGPRAGLGDNMRTRTNFSTVRAGLSYKLDIFGRPVDTSISDPRRALSFLSFDVATANASWGGVHLGVNAGGSFGDVTSTDRLGTFGTGDSVHADSRGVSGGGQIGYDYQLATSNLVIGVETDFQGSSLSGSYDRFTSNGQADWRDGSRVNWWGTARGRVGYALGRILPYATGGFAYGRTTTSGSCSTSAGPFACDQASGSVSGMATGWTAGAGVQYAVTNNLRFKTEYLYTDLGSLNVANTFLDSTFGGPRVSAGDALRTRTIFSTIRAGLDYKLDLFAQQNVVAARY